MWNVAWLRSSWISSERGRLLAGLGRACATNLYPSACTQLELAQRFAGRMLWR